MKPSYTTERKARKPPRRSYQRATRLTSQRSLIFERVHTNQKAFKIIVSFRDATYSVVRSNHFRACFLMSPHYLLRSPTLNPGGRPYRISSALSPRTSGPSDIVNHGNSAAAMIDFSLRGTIRGRRSCVEPFPSGVRQTPLVLRVHLVPRRWSPSPNDRRDPMILFPR